MPCFAPTFLNASMRASRWCFSWAAESCVRMRACPFAHDREEEPDGVDALVEEVARDVLRQLGVVEHHRARSGSRPP